LGGGLFMAIQNILYRKRAFTLVELMITCIIIGVLVSIALPFFMTARLRAEETKAMATLYAYANAQKAFWFDAQGTATDPNTYTSQMTDLMPFVAVLSASGNDDGNWLYFINAADTATFEIEALHQGAPVVSLVLHENGVVDRLPAGGWPY